MEKLQPLIVHRFWICFGIAVIVAPVGHYMASGDLAKKTAAKTSEVEGQFKKIPQDGAISSLYNDDIITNLEKVNDEQKKLVNNATYRLRSTQKQYMVWPKQVSEAMSKVNYRQAPSDHNVLFYYGQAYTSELDRIRPIVSPFDPKTGTGKIQLPAAVLPRANDTAWSAFGPKPDEMWDSQEDIWLTTSILQAIAAVNKQAENITDAPIKALMKLSLHGGKRTLVTNPVVTAPAATAAQPPEGASAPLVPAAKLRATAMVNYKKTDVSFRPALEFGPEEGNQVAKTTGNDDDDRRRGGMKMFKKVQITGEDESAENEKRRYIDHVRTNPYRLRGFYMEVAIDHQYLPEFLAQLTNMPFPTEIVRWQRSVNNGTMIAYVPAAAEEKKETRSRKSLKGFEFGSRTNEDERDLPAAGAPGNDKPSRLFNAAIDDPNVVVVALAGIVTIYPPPDVVPAKSPAAMPGAATKPGKPANGQTAPAAAEPKAAGQATLETPAAKPGAAPAKAATDAVGKAPSPAAGESATPSLDPAKDKAPAEVPKPANGPPPAVQQQPDAKKNNPSPPAATEAKSETSAPPKTELNKPSEPENKSTEKK